MEVGAVNPRQYARLRISSHQDKLSRELPKGTIIEQTDNFTVPL
jgi:hypothetical protein